MKKTIFALSILAMMFASPSDVMAQSLLRRVANAAKSTVEGAVQGAVTGALSGKTKTAAAATTQQTTTPQPAAESETVTWETDEVSEYDYAASLASSEWVDGYYFSTTDANRTGEYDSQDNPILRIKQPNIHFNNSLDVLKALPALPTAKQIVNDADNKAADVLINFELAYQEYYTRKMQERMEFNMKMASVLQQMPAGRPANQDAASLMPMTKDFLDKVMAEAKRRGLNLQTMTEAQSAQVTAAVMSKEFGIPEAEMVKLVAMAQTNPNGAMATLKQKYPAAAKKMGLIHAETAGMQKKLSPEAEKFIDLLEEVNTLFSDEELQQAIMKFQKVMSELEAYAHELNEQWSTSDTYAKLNAMERELDAKTEAYMQAHGTNYNDEAPEVWVEGRKAQNALINAYNERIAELWRAKVQTYIDTYKPYALRIAEAEDRLASAVKTLKAEDLADQYYTYAEVINLFGEVTIAQIYDLPSTAMNAPRVSNVPESWMP